MAEQSVGRTKEPSDGNNPQDNANNKLVRMLEKAHEKQLDNLTTNLTETLSSTLSNMVATIFKITKGSDKRMQEDQVGQDSSKRPELMLSAKKRMKQHVQK